MPAEETLKEDHSKALELDFTPIQVDMCVRQFRIYELRLLNRARSNARAMSTLLDALCVWVDPASS
jgi:hypothetical protein